MKFDQLTIFSVFLLLQPAGVLVYWLTTRRHPHLRGPGWWAVGCILALAGFAGVLWQAITMSSLLAVNLSNTLIVGATMCLWAGLRAFFGRTVSLPMLVSLTLLAGVLHGMFAFLWPSLSARSIVVSTFNGMGTLLALYEVLKQRKTSMQLETNLLGVLLLVDAALHAARILGIVFVNHAANYGTSPLEGIFMLTFLISAIGHEIVMACITKKIRGYGFLAQMSQLPIVMLQRTKWIKGKRVLNNVCFWCSMILGLSMMCSLYVLC